MSDYGVKIKIYQAASVFEVDRGVRNSYDSKDAMLSNSLFLDFLRTHGLQTHKDSTRDVICLEFNYGASSYEETRAKITRKMKELDYVAGYEARLAELETLQDKFQKTSKEVLRELYYEHGITIHYGSEAVHYQMLYRTPGKAKKGSVMFICDRLYAEARNYLYMGLELPAENAPIVEIGAYSSLVTSTIEAKVRITPEQILVLPDVDAAFLTNVMSIEIDDDCHCVAVERSDYKVKNTMFDGQALIDESIFPEYANGYVLLRHHMCKMAAFCSRIQLFFKDYFGADYETAELTDMWGRKIRAADVRLITTDNALKWVKFGVTFDYWAEWVRANGCEFGIVKTAHPSKLGSVQRMSYQMVNAMSSDIMADVTKCSVDYIYNMKVDNNVLYDYLRSNSNFSNDYEVLVALCEQDPEFIQSDYFRERKDVIIKNYTNKIRGGRIIQNADNLVIVGSPYAMLMHSVGLDPHDDPTFKQEAGAIQCFTNRFEDDEYLAEFRSPFNSYNNLGHMHNCDHEYFHKYFNFGRLIIAVNMNGTDFQDLNNGSDQDSDSIYVTNQPSIVARANYCYNNYPTIVNNIPKEKKTYTSSPLDFAAIDNGLAHSQRSIGESSNLAQVCLSYTYNYEDRKYYEYVCILSVIAQASIDSAKRRFNIDIDAEIKRIRDDMNIKENKYPAFWLATHRDFGKDKINWELRCPMNDVYNLKVPGRRQTTAKRSIGEYFYSYEVPADLKLSKAVMSLIEKYSLDVFKSRINLQETANIADDLNTPQDIYLLFKSNFEEMVAEIRQISWSPKYKSLISWLLQQAFLTEQTEENIKIQKNKSLLMKILYDANPQVFLEIFSKNISKYGN